MYETRLLRHCNSPHKAPNGSIDQIIEVATSFLSRSVDGWWSFEETASIHFLRLGFLSHGGYASIDS